jgi:hypothetical protein
MNSNPILEEAWKIKDELAREANNDVHQLCEDTRRWAKHHPHTGPVVRDAEELRRFVAQQEMQRTAQALTLNEKSPGEA